MKKWVILFAITAVIGCKKEDDKYEAIVDGEINLNEEFGPRFNQVSIGEDYSYQVYFDLGDNEAKAHESKFLWDIALTSDTPGVLMNHAISGLRVALSPFDWQNTNAATNVELGYDLIGEQDLYIGNNFFGNTYIIDRGYDASGNSLGTMKFKVDWTNGSYLVTSDALNGGSELTFNVTPSSDQNYAYLSLENGEQFIAPPKTEWDILFTHYLYVYDPYTEPFPYQVTGVLINPHMVTAVEITDYGYEEVDLSISNEYDFSNDPDTIGFDWKYFDFDLGFIVDDTRVYLVQDVEGDRYKLHFTSFYDENGVKGNPQFEFQKLR